MRSNERGPCSIESTRPFPRRAYCDFFVFFRFSEPRLHFFAEEMMYAALPPSAHAVLSVLYVFTSMEQRLPVSSCWMLHHQLCALVILSRYFR